MIIFHSSALLKCARKEESSKISPNYFLWDIEFLKTHTHTYTHTHTHTHTHTQASGAALLRWPGWNDDPSRFYKERGLLDTQKPLSRVPADMICYFLN
jgi:hypothetical protein